jgi:hypothetical protein
MWTRRARGLMLADDGIRRLAAAALQQAITDLENEREPHTSDAQRFFDSNDDLAHWCVPPPVGAQAAVSVDVNRLDGVMGHYGIGWEAGIRTENSFLNLPRQVPPHFRETPNKARCEPAI